MGKTPKPLSFLIHPSLVQTSEDNDRLCELESQGHTVVRDVPSDVIKHLHYDIILSPNAWRAFDLKHLDLAMKSARAVKYVKKSEAKPKKPRAPRKKKSDAGPESE